MEPEQNSQQPTKPDQIRENVVRSVFDGKQEKTTPSSIFTPTDNSRPLMPQTDTVGQGKTEQKRVKVAHLKKGTSSIGVDIGGSSIKIAQLAADEGRIVVERFVDQNFPQGITPESKAGQAFVADILKDFMSSLTSSGQKIFSAVPSQLVNLRRVSFPPMPEEEVSQAVDWDVKQDAGQQYAKITYDYAILGQADPSKKGFDVVIISAEQDLIARHMNILETAGAKVEAIEPEAFSLLRGLDLNGKIDRQQVSILLDFGGSSTRLDIICNDEIQFSRSLNIHGGTLTKAIQEYCLVSYDQAEELKKKFILTGEPSSPASQPGRLTENGAEGFRIEEKIQHAISLQLEKLVTDVEHTFKYFSYQMTKSEITKYDKVILCGGMANFSMMRPFFQERLGVPVETGAFLNCLDLGQLDEGTKEKLIKNNARLGVAFGLALRPFEDNALKGAMP